MKHYEACEFCAKTAEETRFRCGVTPADGFWWTFQIANHPVKPWEFYPCEDSAHYFAQVCRERGAQIFGIYAVGDSQTAQDNQTPARPAAAAGAERRARQRMGRWRKRNAMTGEWAGGAAIATD